MQVTIHQIARNSLLWCFIDCCYIYSLLAEIWILLFKLLEFRQLPENLHNWFKQGHSYGDTWYVIHNEFKCLILSVWLETMTLTLCRIRGKSYLGFIRTTDICRKARVCIIICQQCVVFFHGARPICTWSTKTSATIYNRIWPNSPYNLFRTCWIRISR